MGGRFLIGLVAVAVAIGGGGPENFGGIFGRLDPLLPKPFV